VGSDVLPQVLGIMSISNRNFLMKSGFMYQGVHYALPACTCSSQ
jgi:hypothetical protein